MTTLLKRWTLEEAHSLPDDGNKYELVRGELFVTPPPNEDHETIAARLSRVLDPYVAAQGLGFVYHPRAVMRFDHSEVEPDLMVRPPKKKGTKDWDEAPTPLLIVEVQSPSTRRRDNLQKRSLYLDAGVEEYWMVDPDRRTVTVVRAEESDQIASDTFSWHPTGAAIPLTIDVGSLFD
ncbi:MAG TPA: Uma2 family endonuclease [Gemmatimonadaceae bacterium]|jgi:Uma2 family endonuclease